MSILLLTVFSLLLTTVTAQNCTAAFSYGPTDITIDFMDQSTVIAGDQIIAWSWDFDDGSFSSEQNPTHTFPEADRYDVALTITTQNGCSNTVEVRIETCVLASEVAVGPCDANGNVNLFITINDFYDNADEIFVSIDTVEVPGSPFEIDAENPVSLNIQLPGDGLEHLLTVLSDDIETCGT